MKLKIISRCKANKKIYNVGDEDNFKDDLGEELLEKKLAIPLTMPKKEKPKEADGE